MVLCGKRGNKFGQVIGSYLVFLVNDGFIRILLEIEGSTVCAVLRW